MNTVFLYSIYHPPQECPGFVTFAYISLTQSNAAPIYTPQFPLFTERSMRRALYAMLFLSMLQCAVAYASLGSAPSNFGTTPQLKQGARSLAAAGNANYTVSQSTLDGGTVVREYSDSSGVVFAVSWNGPFLPDLRTLLGTHFDTLRTEAAKKPKAGHSQLAVDRSDVVIVSNGHMRSFSGKAWIPGALPAGFSTDSME